MTTYNKEQLRHIFQSPFNQEAWKAILINLFRVDKIRKDYERIPDLSDNEEGFYMGSTETADGYRIGLFYFKIKKGSVAHKKVGLRNLVKKFINENWGAFEAAIVVFDSNSEWRLSFVCDIKEQATAPKRFTFVFGEHDNNYRTPVERFLELQAKDATFENIRKAFSVEALSDDFFDGYRNLYADFVQYITGKRYVKEGGKWVEKELGNPNNQFETTFFSNDKLVRDYIKKMFGRIVFLYFLQRKGWLNGNRNYMHDLFANSDKKNDFLDGVLEPLFFFVLNTDKPYRTDAARALPGVDNIPYLNGGLFAQDEVDPRTCVFPQEYFARLFGFLDSYNFTIDENDTEDAEIGIDPEMLGRIFENLLEDNKDKGAFYTPKEIVNYMCRESIIAYLQNGYESKAHPVIREFIETLDPELLTADQKLKLLKKLVNVKICDPAIGSGAFPMGMVNLLSKVFITLKEDADTAKMKRHIMEQSIYGVDIERGAVDIARLRFWLAMIVEEKEPMPLPNLHFKIMQGNSLLESYQGINLSDLTQTSEDNYSLFNADNYERESLAAALRQYYGTSEHDKRDRLFNEIIRNVRRQLEAKEIILPAGTDPSANTDFFLWHTWFSDVFASGGFDIVIGNPPYIQLQKSLGYTAKDKKGKDYDVKLGDLYKDSAYDTFEKTGDIYCLFYELGNRLLKPCGHLCYITSNKWMRAGYGESLRLYLSKKTNPKVLLDFGGIQIFENATVDTNILLFEHANNSHSTAAVTAAKHDKSILKNLSDFVQQNAAVVDFSTSESWVILSPIEMSIKKKIEAVGVPLKDWDISIYRGVLTGYNEAFIISTEKRNEILANCADEAERQRTEELIRPILRGRDIKRYGYDWAGLWLINTHNGIKGKLERIHIEDYPAVKAHLDQYWDKISVRADKGDTPYNLRNCAYLDDFSKPQIVWLELTDEPKFTLVNEIVSLNTVFFMTGEHLPHILGQLNSKLITWYFHKCLGARSGVGTNRWLKYTIEQLPLAPYSEEYEDNALSLSRDYSSNQNEVVNHLTCCIFGLTDAEEKIVNQFYV